MIRHKISLVSSVIVLACCLLGCQTSSQSQVRLTSHAPSQPSTHTILASYRPSMGVTQNPKPVPAAPAIQESSPQKDESQNDKQRADEEKAGPTPAVAKTLYTSPSSASALAIASAALGSTQDMTNGGQEASENIGISTSFRQALQPSVSIGDGGSIGKRGLQRGSPLTGSNNLNIFTPRSNGITNRCQELITAGFFADITGCRNHFSR